MSIKLILSTVLTATSLTAFAADLPRKTIPAAVMAPVPASTWEGLYVGGHLGAGGSRITDSTNANIVGINGIYGGLQAGYDWQFGQLVAGIAADISLGNSRGSDTAGTIVETMRGTARGRLGYLVTPYFLVYGTGGLAFNGMKYTNSGAAVNGVTYLPANLSQTVNNTGFMLGAGGEVKVDRNWSVFSEFRYTKYSAGNYSSFAPVPRIGSENLLDARVGVNYRF